MGRFEQDFSFDQVQYVRGRLSGLWELRVEESFKDSISPLVVNGYANSKGLQKRVFEGFFDGRALWYSHKPVFKCPKACGGGCCSFELSGALVVLARN